uniref:Uncharacterized protein n=1 Tax=Anguilla anguilla TaxID=7936 RepID=A0A0E9W5F7_ANGAN
MKAVKKSFSLDYVIIT